MPRPVPLHRCRFCRLLQCPHCPECGANLVDTGHDRGCTRGPHCRACRDTGVNSRGAECVPCELKGLLPRQRKAAGRGGLYDD